MRHNVPALWAALLALLLTACTPGAAEIKPPPPPTATVTAPPPEGPPGPDVATDWSHLTPYAPEEPLYTRRYAAYTDTLHPAGDYGPLVPYLGADRGEAGDLYGLVTLEGELVTDPVFTQVWRGGTSGGYHDNPPLPYLMLTRGVSSPSRDAWPGPSLWAMAAPDGSWCTEFKYVMEEELVLWGRDDSSGCGDDGLFVLDGSALVYLDGATGEERIRIPQEGNQSQAFSALSMARWVDGEVRCDGGERTSPPPAPPPGPETNGFLVDRGGWRWYRDGGELVFLRDGEERRLRTDATPGEAMWGQIVFLHEEDGGITYMSLDGRVLGKDSKGKLGYEGKAYDQVTGRQYVRIPTGRGYDLYDGDGEKLSSVSASVRIYDVLLAGGLVQVHTPTACTLYTRAGELVFRYPLAPGEQD